MWQTDTVTIQTKSEVNTLGSISVIWSDSENVTCDVQDISQELAFKEYGMTKAGDYKQVFDLTNNSNWLKGNQVKYSGEQYWVMLVDANMTKMNASNHTFILLLRDT